MTTHKHDPYEPDLDSDLTDDDAELDIDLDADDEWESGYADEDPETEVAEETGGDWDLEARYALKRVGGLRTELEDITEVEYRQLRLERVVLVGVWTEGTTASRPSPARARASPRGAPRGVRRTRR